MGRKPARNALQMQSPMVVPAIEHGMSSLIGQPPRALDTPQLLLDLDAIDAKAPLGGAGCLLSQAGLQWVGRPCNDAYHS